MSGPDWFEPVQSQVVSDGTTAVVMEPMEFMERLAALVPAPRRHVLRYHGTLAPHAKWRALIVPLAASAGTRADGKDATGRQSRTSRIPWADLLKRVFKIDVLECPRCHGRLKVVASVTSPAAIRAILECLGLPARPPPVAPAREREQAEFGFDG